VPNPGLLECGFHVLELMLGEERLAVASEQPTQHLVGRVAHAEPHLGESRLVRLVVTESAPSEGLFDRGVEVMRLELCDPPSAVTPDADGSEEVPFSDADCDHLWNRFQHRGILLADVFVLSGPGQAESHVRGLNGSDRDPDVLGELGEGSIGAWEAPPGTLQIAKLQMSGRVRRCQRFGIQALGLQLLDDASAHDVTPEERPAFGLQESQIDQLANTIG
jgi:hypothetical protein